ncbi:hypothetical protein GA0115239_101724 [Streptomyces sp. BpilaLS-43]|uniref:hypothetical protein n=1 Tax=Streptomyces sp. BpilaLS-43 TaxID=1839778 RepID=UPI00081AFC2F|nr:hypothetical protein [Streptomyces sp. BpilaLS-43]SCD43112.1 hypothetical protein GA0115239_101724 [Streptomyces sp. BpilaLS-43]
MSGSSERRDGHGEGAPRWVKVPAAIAALAVVVFVIVHLAGCGMAGHTPWPPFPARLRKLTLHVTSSMGWLGAVAVFLALAAAGLASSSPQTARGAYTAMDAVGW